jgi:hypothetical protein
VGPDEGETGPVAPLVPRVALQIGVHDLGRVVGVTEAHRVAELVQQQ